MKASLLFAWHLRIVALGFGSVCAFGYEARADAQSQPKAPSAADVAEADRLFKQAASHMDRREYEAACPLLERSHALDPSGGTLLNLGDCYEQRGLSALAYRAFEEARGLAASTGRTDRVQVAELRKKRLLPILRTLILVPPDVHPETLLVHLDGKPVARTSWNVPVPVDAGAHDIRVTAPGHSDYDTTVSAPDPGAAVSVRIPALRSLAPPSSADTPSSGRGLDGQQVAAIACAVLGVAGVTTGTVFGLQSQSKHEESDAYCTGNACQDARGVALMDDARRAGNVSTVGFIAGGVGLGAAAVLWLVRPFGNEAAAAELGLGPGTIRVRGRW